MRSVDTDTIAAIATAQGRAGVGIVRVSGADLRDFALELTRSEPKPRHASRASFHDARGDVIDDGLLLYFPAPHSYTGQDVLEMQGHGSPVALQILLRRCLELGARLAEPGEFTRRAFLNDKLDLAQAEAVADLIDAATEGAVRSAARSLRGDFSVLIHAFLEQLIDLRMRVEAGLDFPEEEIETEHRSDLRRRLERLQAAVDQAVISARQGSLLRTGLQVALVGPPNVGKSSLLNRLAGEELAIVTPLPGTTRDVVRQMIQIEGVPIHVADTAGLRETADEIEQIGIQRTRKEIESADLLIVVVEAQPDPAVSPHAALGAVPPAQKKVVVHNKIDLLAFAPRVEGREDGLHVFLSAKTGEGLELLRRAVLESAGWRDDPQDVFIARERHVQALLRAKTYLAAADRIDHMPELYAEELRGAQKALAEVTGDFDADDLLGEIFSRFCIGK